MKKTSLIIATFLIIAILLVGLGYAAINGLSLDITGTLSATTNQDNFSVGFLSDPAVSNNDNVSAVITGGQTATLTVEGLNAKGDTAYAIYTIKNKSNDLAALLSAELDFSNDEYFDVDYEFVDSKTTVISQDTTDVKIIVKLIKTPVSSNVSSTVTLNITAAPANPEDLAE